MEHLANESKTEELIRLLLQRSEQEVDQCQSPGLKRNVLTTGVRLILSSQVWINALPTKHCDVMVTVPPSRNDSEENVNWVIRQFRRDSRLNLDCHYHLHTNTYVLYITARRDDLLKGADLMQMRKRLKDDAGGGVKDFVYKDADSFVGVHDRHFLNSQERAVIVFSFLNNLRAIGGESIGNTWFMEGELILPALRRSRVVSQILPLHNQRDLRRLKRNWVAKFLQPQPLGDIKNYFGEQIAMYFAWLGHYTKALIIPAVLGIIHWSFMWGGDQAAEDLGIVSFAVVNILWATLYLESWKRRQAEVAYRWGTLSRDNDLLQEPRPEFKGRLCQSPVTGRLDTFYSSWKQNLFRYLISYPATFACISIMFCIMLTVFRFQHLCDRELGESYYFSWVIFMPKVVLAIIVTVADESYAKLAVWLNDKENYRTDEAYENNLIIKTVIFQSFNSFLPLFYIAFYLNDMDRLRSQLAALLITRQLIGNFKEAVFPLFVEKLKLSRITYNMTKKMDKSELQKHVEQIREERRKLLSSPGGHRPRSTSGEPTSSAAEEEAATDRRSIADNQGLRQRRPIAPSAEPDSGRSDRMDPPQLTQAEIESLLPRYNSPLPDYLEMYIQFGLVLLFSPAFPLAATCALLNNIFEIHVDAFKLCNSFQRPFGKRVANIGTWEAAIEAMGIVGVMVNCALIGYSGVVHRFWPDLSFGGQILFVVVLEHLVLALKFFISIAIPDVPQWIIVELAKVELKRRTVLRKLEGRCNQKRARSESIRAVGHVA